MILLDRVTKTYPGDEDPALDNVSLHIEPHEFVFLVGKSGAGKSTLIKMITKEETPDSGKIVIGGIDLDFVRRRHIPHYRRRLGVVFQDYKLLPTRTVFENVSFALEIAGLSNREIQKTVPKVLDLVGLADKAHKFPTHLSGGERQRVSIARSMARQPKILIADEPTGNLDKLTRREIIDLLQRINDFGTTLLVTTHDENIVNNLSKRVVTLKGGRIVDDQKVNGIYRLDSEPEDTPMEAAAELENQLGETLFIRSVPKTPTADARLSFTMEDGIYIEHKRPAVGARPAKNSNLAAKGVKSAKKSGENAKDRKTNSKTKTTRSAKATARNASMPNIANDTVPQPVKKSVTRKTTSPQPFAQDSANQWYTASKPLKSAPKLSNLSGGQTIKLKPAPSLSQAVKKPIPRPRARRVI